MVWRSGAASCGVLGRTGALCVAAAVKVRDAPQFRHCWAVGATGWVTNNLNTLLAGIHRDLPCTWYCIAAVFWGVSYERGQHTGSSLCPCVSPTTNQVMYTWYVYGYPLSQCTPQLGRVSLTLHRVPVFEKVAQSILTYVLFVCVVSFKNLLCTKKRLDMTFFLSQTSTFQLLDKPWSQVSSLLPPGSCLQY